MLCICFLYVLYKFSIWWGYGEDMVGIWSGYAEGNHGSRGAYLLFGDSSNVRNVIVTAILFPLTGLSLLCRNLNQFAAWG